MLNTISAALVVATLAAFSQTTAPGAAPAGKPADPKAKPLVLTGCVAHADADKYTVKDDKRGIFELAGKGLDIYIGKRVEINGTSTATNGLHITTGLYPSPNAAAQAGSDPVRAFTDSMPGGAAHGTGRETAPTFTVTRVTAVKGDCK
jgi:hypothetical protein